MDKRRIVFSVLAILLVVALVIIIAATDNDSPKADSNTVKTREDTPVSITLTGTDSDQDQLTYRVLEHPSHGSISGTEPYLTYTPNVNFSGQDSFTFKVNDGRTDSAAAVVSITVTGANDPPKANDDSATAQEDAPIVTIDVLANDADFDADRMAVVRATQGSNGSVTINTNGTLTYAPNVNFCGTDKFTYTVSDGKGGMDTATVNVAVNAVNDAPSITSKPVETTRVWASYAYRVEARDDDPGDALTYSLITRPEGMSIDPATGLIEWRPTNAQVGSYDVLVKVADSNSIPASDTQSFAVTVASLSSPLKTTLTVADCFSQKGRARLSAKDKIAAVQASDDRRWETEPASYICFDFCDASIPAGATIISAVVYLEHFEEEEFTPGGLKWSVGMGWPADPVVWASMCAPARAGERNEATDSWDITSSVDTPDKADCLQLQVKSSNISAGRKTSVDHLYAVVTWY